MLLALLALLLAFAGAGCVSVSAAAVSVAVPEVAPDSSAAAAAEAAAAFAAGDCGGARAAWWRALLLARDPCARAAVAREFAACIALTTTPAALQALIRARLDAGDLDGVDALLGDLRRCGGDAEPYYRLRSRAQRLSGDPETAWANALLAREHATLPGPTAACAPMQSQQAAGAAPAVAADSAVPPMAHGAEKVAKQ